MGAEFGESEEEFVRLLRKSAELRTESLRLRKRFAVLRRGLKQLRDLYRRENV